MASPLAFYPVWFIGTHSFTAVPLLSKAKYRFCGMPLTSAFIAFFNSHSPYEDCVRQMSNILCEWIGTTAEVCDATGDAILINSRAPKKYLKKILTRILHSALIIIS